MRILESARRRGESSGEPPPGFGRAVPRRWQSYDKQHRAGRSGCMSVREANAQCCGVGISRLIRPGPVRALRDVPGTPRQYRDLGYGLFLIWR